MVEIDAIANETAIANAARADAAVYGATAAISMLRTVYNLLERITDPAVRAKADAAIQAAFTEAGQAIPITH